MRLRLFHHHDHATAEVVLSRRNLLALLQKLDVEGSARTLVSNDCPDGLALVVRAEDDGMHYADRPEPPGPMHPLTAGLIWTRSPADTCCVSPRPPSIDAGVAGASARREAARRKGRQMLSRPAENSWNTGARGEEMLAESLAKRCPRVLLLHDRRMPGTRANIDHLAVSATGVYVIDAKRYHGKIEVRKPLLGAPKLIIAGRDRTKLIAGLDRQVTAVRFALTESAPDIAVQGCLCFLAPEGFLADSGLPILRQLKIDGYRLFYPRMLAKALNKPGPIDGERAQALQAELAQRFPSA